MTNKLQGLNMNKINLNFKMAKKEDISSIIKHFMIYDGSYNKYFCDILDLDYNKFQNASKREQKRQITFKSNQKYETTKEQMKNKLSFYKDIWDKHIKEIEQALTNVFGDFIDQDCYAMITFNNVIYPRYLDYKSFDFSFDMNEANFLLTAIHEIIHFIWFDKLKILMPEIERKEYEYPSPIWKFSEIAVDQVFNSQPILMSLIKDSGRNPAYDEFHIDKIGNETIVEYFRKLYKSCKTIDEFIIKGTNESIELFGKTKEL